jgi:CBS domain-containing protein
MVMKDDELIGILTERDIIKRLYQDKGNVKDLKISEVMTAAKDIITVDEEESIEEAMDIMIKYSVRHIPVFKGDKITGVISIGDVVKALLFVAKKEKEILKDYINSSY